MTIYNSQHVNRDPYPYTTNGSWGGKPLRSDEPYFQGSYDPRPEYDNNPNPVLVYYRAAGVPDDWEQDLLHLAFMHTPEHIDHARKVLERLATL